MSEGFGVRNETGRRAAMLSTTPCVGCGLRNRSLPSRNRLVCETRDGEDDQEAEHQTDLHQKHGGALLGDASSPRETPDILSAGKRSLACDLDLGSFLEPQ